MKVFVDAQEKRKTVRYRLDLPVRARDICIIAGAFDVLPDMTSKITTSFCPAGRIQELAHCVSFTATAIAFLEKFFGIKYPFDSCKQVFVDNAYEDVSCYAGVSVLR